MLFIVTLSINLYFLIPEFSLMGVVSSFLIAEIVRSLASSYLAQLAYPLAWKYKPIIYMLGGIMITVIFTKLFLNFQSIWPKTLLYVVIILFLFSYYFRLIKGKIN